MRQVHGAIAEAHVIVLVTEALAGLRQEERRLLHQLLKGGKPVVIAVNNLNDNPPVFISGTTGSVDENAATSTPIYSAATTDGASDHTLEAQFQLQRAEGDCGVDDVRLELPVYADPESPAKSIFTLSPNSV